VSASVRESISDVADGVSAEWEMRIRLGERKFSFVFSFMNQKEFFNPSPRRGANHEIRDEP
jgi:hypothetical protein